VPLFLGLLLALLSCACSSSSSASTSTSAAATPAANSSPTAVLDRTPAIQKLAAAIESRFADVQGKLLQDNANVTAHDLSPSVPGMVCRIVDIKITKERVANCVESRVTQTDADAAFADAKNDVSSAMPSLVGKDINANDGKYVGEYLYSDGVRAILVYEQHKAAGEFAGQYAIVMTFATSAFFK
jgi:hypothetical protein